VRLNPFARRLSAGVPKMSVRRHVPWPLRVAVFAAILLLAAGAAIWAWQGPIEDAFFERRSLVARIAELEKALAVETAEGQRLSAQVNATDSRLKVERSAGEQLATQVKTLEVENARLKADLTYLETLLPVGTSEGVIAIRRFEVQRAAQAGQLRYRALLTQDARSEKDFEGTLQLLVSTESGGRKATLTVPESAVDASGRTEGIRISFRRYQRVEGIFEVPEGVSVKSVQLRVLEGGSLRAQQTVMM
jgi:septal ring factor EnvC (AmiA/AmiB activator)